MDIATHKSAEPAFQVFIVDDSGSSESVTIGNHRRSLSVSAHNLRQHISPVITPVHADWKKVRDALIGVIEKSVQYESDGIDIYFFNSPMVVNHLSTSSGVKELFKRVKPEGGSTPTSKALQNVVEPYLKDLESAYKAKMEKPDATHKHIKPLNVVILTDGAPSPGFAPETVIMVSATDSSLGMYVEGEGD